MSGAAEVLIPMFIKSPSLEGLQSAMNETNKFYKKSFKYDWKWANKKDGYVACYYLNTSDLKQLAELKNNKG